MPGDAPTAVILLAVGVLCLGALPGVLDRRMRTSSRAPRSAPLSRPVDAAWLPIVCSFVSAVGAIVLLPCLAALSWMSAIDLFWGALLFALVALGTWYAVASRAPAPPSRTRK